MDGISGSDVPESYEEMSEAQRENWHRARAVLASERPYARITLRTKFESMSVDERRAELEKAQQALESLDDATLMGRSDEEEPFERDCRINLEETVKILTADPQLVAG